MNAVEIAEIQRRIGAAPDGIWGPLTWAALFAFAGCRDAGRAEALGLGGHRHLKAYGIFTPLRIAHFMAQAAHETGDFCWLEEIWGPTNAQQRYEGRLDLGNTQAGDGYRFRGRGIFQLTGRANYRDMSVAVRRDLLAEPELAADPEISVQIAASFWKSRRLSPLADQDRVEAITKKINGGLNGFPRRVAKLERLKEVLL
ncbi:hypothetical protein BSL82_05615 [Tardibacter chloracetimidivorans]|uniref:Glycoside hydrolase family 19 catalytic domain-containing protein n=1 Tax=Tardibacter chloracetimidivorans TaxID=1921510 RepID=A0A1L3ZTC9_9SPHN|nr:glycoside hydrolase family 19 protein [Tardibacter chloracetimidivorans]API58850.1 hypothetical protein BSL82_05615 [Tardibacter chloracetimidivorans]